MNECGMAAAVVKLQRVIAEEVSGRMLEGGVEYDPKADLCDMVMQVFGC